MRNHPDPFLALIYQNYILSASVEPSAYRARTYVLGRLGRVSLTSGGGLFTIGIGSLSFPKPANGLWPGAAK